MTISQDEAFKRAAELISNAVSGDDVTVRALTSSLILADLDQDSSQMVAMATAVTCSGFFQVIAERTDFPLVEVWSQYVKEVTGG